MLVVAHTHWDREWYHVAARFRQRLVALLDALLAASPDASVPFLLDGQTVTLWDYLSVRPERVRRLSLHLAAGSLEAGPWYVLADNLIPSGEAIVRNLQAGARTLRHLGASAPSVAYCPDSFGHPAAMPMIAVGFGIGLAIVWRGLGGSSHPIADTMWWRSRDSSTVLLYHLPQAGYEFGSSLPDRPDEAGSRWTHIVDTLGKRNHTGVMLLMAGADHHAPQPRLEQRLSIARQSLIDSVDGRVPVVSVERASLSNAARWIIAAAHIDKPNNGRLSTSVVGELRDSYGYTWTLQGTFATRAHQKRTNARLERALLRDVEPWTALAWIHGGISARKLSPEGHITLDQLSALVWHAWETLLRTHPHDTLCGCCSDDVATAMHARQISVHSQIAGIRQSALENALQHDSVVARRTPIATLLSASNADATHHGLPLVVRNRVSRRRSGIVEVSILETLAHVAVGPDSASTISANLKRMGRIDAVVIAGAGVKQFQQLRSTLRHERRESPQHYPDDDIVRETKGLMWVDDVPANGLRVVHVHVGPETNRGVKVDHAPATMPAELRAVRCETDAESLTLNNGILNVRVTHGRVDVMMGERVLHDAISLETVRDEGDSYTASLRGYACKLVMMRARAGARGPFRGSIVIDWEYREPGRPAAVSDVDSYRENPSIERYNACIRVRTVIALDAGASHLRCDVTIDNKTRDHRLQLVFSSDVSPGARTTADAAFGAVDRPPIKSPPSAAETAPCTMPMHRWATSADDGRGATIFSDGLAEAEVKGARLAITLLLAIGELSRSNLPERPGHAGWPMPIPDAQCQGVYRARVGLLLHSELSDKTLEAIEDCADALLLPLVGTTWRDLGDTPDMLAGPELVGHGLRGSAVTLSRDGKALILRALNRSSETAKGHWRMPTDGPWRAVDVRLDETVTGNPVIVDRDIPVSVPPYGLSTVRIEKDDG